MKVWISSIGCAGDDTTEQKGKLTAGFGAEANGIGPEFTFGIYMEKMLNEPILLIKTSWGGKDLHTAFRSPSAGPYVWSDSELSHYKNRSSDLEKAKADKIKATGVYYRLMLEHVRKVLGDIERVVPDYDPSQGYEIAGFVWFQGFNDLVSDWTYPDHNKPGGYDLYSVLLTHFIRDDGKSPEDRFPMVSGERELLKIRHPDGGHFLGVEAGKLPALRVIRADPIKLRWRFHAAQAVDRSATRNRGPAGIALFRQCAGLSCGHVNCEQRMLTQMVRHGIDGLSVRRPADFVRRTVPCLRQYPLFAAGPWPRGRSGSRRTPPRPDRRRSLAQWSPRTPRGR